MFQRLVNVMKKFIIAVKEYLNYIFINAKYDKEQLQAIGSSCTPITIFDASGKSSG